MNNLISTLLILTEQKISVYYLFFLIVFLVVVFTSIVRIKELSHKKHKAELNKKREENRNLHKNILYASECYDVIPIPMCTVNMVGVIKSSNSCFRELFVTQDNSFEYVGLEDIFPEAMLSSFKEMCMGEKEEMWLKGKFSIKKTVYRVKVNQIPKDKDQLREYLVCFKPFVEIELKDEHYLTARGVLETLIRKSTVPIMLINNNGKILVGNEPLCKIYGSFMGSLDGRNISEVLPVEFQEGIKNSFSELLSMSKMNFRGAFSSNSGRLIPVTVGVVKVNLDGTENVVVFVDDVSLLISSENRLIEVQKKAKHSDLLKSSFLANLSHEIRTPLNAILGFSELLNDPSVEDADRTGLLGQIKQSGESLLDLMTSIITFSRISSGEVGIQTSEIEMDELMERVKRFASKTKGLTGKLININSYHIDLPKKVKIILDEDKLFVVLKNLVDNAIKFTFSGSVEFGMEERSESFLKFYVKDTGVGIPIESRKTIYERFVQANLSSTREFGGTGIGLTLAAELVRLLRGFLWIESTVGVGSCFNIVLPKVYREVDNNGAIKILGGDCCKKSILIIDNSEDAFCDLQEITCCKSQQSFWAIDINEAVDIFYSNYIDLIMINGAIPCNEEHRNRFISLAQKEVPVLSFNKRIEEVSNSRHFSYYPFTEKTLMGIYKTYFSVHSVAGN